MRKREQVFRVGEREGGTERDENVGVEDTRQSFRKRWKRKNEERD